MPRTKRVVTEVSRKRLSDAYVENMVSYLSHSRGITEAEALTFITSIVKNNIRLPNIDVIQTIAPGRLERNTLSFKDFMNIAESSVITPSGSLYTPVNKQRSFVSALIKEGLQNRSVIKKKMLKALDEGRKDDATKFKAEQNTIKIKLNALPGSFGSPSNLFYDKGGYNAVTSTARMLISNSFTCCEQFLGGNLPLFNVEELFNLITLAHDVCPPMDDISNVMREYKMTWVTIDEVMEYFTKQLQMYIPEVDLVKEGVYAYLKTMPSYVVQFLYYHSNLKHLVFKNEHIFRTVIDKMFTYSVTDEIPSSIIPEQFYKCNGEIMAIVTTIVSKELESIKIKDMIEHHPEKARLCVNVHKHVTSCLEELQPILNIFVYHNLNFQHVLHRSMMQRKTVVVSDTDSVIYTAKDWAEWYTKSIDKVTHDSYNIAALATYLLTEANADTMAKYIIAIGAIDTDIATIQMKNEFLYPSLMLFDIKKTYAGIIKVQEGVLLPESKPDIKGSNVRGASASLEAREFIKKIIVEDILKPVIDGNISARDLIEKTVAFESSIWTSLHNGELKFLPIVSVGTQDSYDEEDRTAYFYAKAWNYIFGKKYGDINPPDKLKCVKLLDINELHLAQLKEIAPDIHEKFTRFIAENKKAPSALFIEPALKHIPKEIMHLIDYRHIVYSNVSPIHLVLESINVGIGYSKKQMLFTDIYDAGFNT